MDVDLFLKQQISLRDEQGLLRTLKHPESKQTDFTSNDYLGLARNRQFIDEIKIEIEKVGAAGSTGSRLLSGQSRDISELEEQIAVFHGSEASLLFPTGYMANLALVSSLGRKGVTSFIDQHVHASIRDGLRMAGARYLKFRHNDADQLEAMLKKENGPKVVIVDAVYSMEGDLAPLNDLISLCIRYGSALVVDEAHSIGIFGPAGRGLVSMYGLEDKVMAKVMTYGKAPGVQGGAIVCDNKMKDYLINFARPFIFSTAPSPLLVAAIRASYKMFPELDTARECLFHLIDIANRFGSALRFPFNGAIQSPICPVLIPGNEMVKNVANQCNRLGYDVRPILTPTVPSGQERIRIIIHAYNTEHEVRSIFNLLRDG